MKPERETRPPEIDWRLTTFEGARREQLRRWAQLPLEDILRAIEEMQNVAHEFGAAPTGESGESARGVPVSESPAEYGKGGADQQRDDDKRVGS
jgi:hypothetical protein